MPLPALKRKQDSFNSYGSDIFMGKKILSTSISNPEEGRPKHTPNIEDFVILP